MLKVGAYSKVGRGHAEVGMGRIAMKVGAYYDMHCNSGLGLIQDESPHLGAVGNVLIGNGWPEKLDHASKRIFVD
jgi:hypothetical protein